MASIAKDGLLVVRHCDPLSPPSDLIIVPRSVLDGLVTALHIKLDHPSKHQLSLVLKRHFYALDMSKAIDHASDSCHTCATLKRFPKTLVKQSTEDPPDLVGISYAADVLKREKRLILVVRETVSSYTTACFIDDEKHESLRNGLVRLLMPLKPIGGPSCIVRVDPAPGFRSLHDDEILKQFNISLDIGRVKNPNKNPVAEKAIAELEDEILREEKGQSPLNEVSLAVATARLNTRLRKQGLSSREIWTQRNQFTHEQLPIVDMNIIRAQHEARESNHCFSEISKCKRPGRPIQDIAVGDLVYLYSDKSKTQSRSRYLVVSLEGEWCFVKKFTGNQLRSSSYKVKLDECYKVPTQVQTYINRPVYNLDSDTEEYLETSKTPAPEPPPPPDQAEPPPILVCERSEDIEDIPQTDPLIVTPTNHDNPTRHSYQGDAQRVLRKRSELKMPSRFNDFILK